jgi:hypothetical protein
MIGDCDAKNTQIIWFSKGSKLQWKSLAREEVLQWPFCAEVSIRMNRMHMSISVASRFWQCSS